MNQPMKTEIGEPPSRLRTLLQFVVCLIPAILGLSLICSIVVAEDGAKSAQTNAPPPKAQQKSKKELTGAELYAINCNRCHPERYAPERTEEQWKTIILHMRTRANIPAAQARAILKYLQEDSGK